MVGKFPARSAKTEELRVFQWREETGVDFLSGFGGGAYNWYPTDTTPSGSVIVGYRWPAGTAPSPSSQDLGWRWEDGKVEIIGDLAGGEIQSRAHGVSADGSVVVGHSATNSDISAFIWDSDHGMRPLHEVLRQRGAPLRGWRLQAATAVSADGTWIAGQGINPQGKPEAFLVSLPSSN